MNFGTTSTPERLNSLLQVQVNKKFAQWRELLSACTRKAGRRDVHGLRSLSLRLSVLQGLVAEGQHSQALNRWGKAVRKLRRALGPVRNADVFVSRLGLLRKEAKELKLSPICLREMDKLEGKLKKERAKSTAKLMLKLKAGGKRLKRVSCAYEATVLSQGDVGKSSEKALLIFSELAQEIPALDGDSLHEFRKRMKESLYLAEFAAQEGSATKKLLLVLRKMHQGSGEWHDWHAMAEAARRLLPKADPQAGLLAVLESKKDLSIKRALEICRSQSANYFKVKKVKEKLPPRKPVASVMHSDKNTTPIIQIVG
jgi:CHAD domain-containing protein